MTNDHVKVWNDVQISCFFFKFILKCFQLTLFYLSFQVSARRTLLHVSQDQSILRPLPDRKEDQGKVSKILSSPFLLHPRVRVCSSTSSTLLFIFFPILVYLSSVIILSTHGLVLLILSGSGGASCPLAVAQILCVLKDLISALVFFSCSLLLNFIIFSSSVVCLVSSFWVCGVTAIRFRRSYYMKRSEINEGKASKSIDVSVVGNKCRR